MTLLHKHCGGEIILEVDTYRCQKCGRGYKCVGQEHYLEEVSMIDSHEQARAVGPGPIPSTLNPESERRDPKTLSVTPIPQGNSTEEP
jgi:hypothetical protein